MASRRRLGPGTVSSTNAARGAGGVADEEDSAVAGDRVKAPRGDAVLDGPRPDAERAELRAGDDTSLAGGKLRDVLVDMARVSFGLHVSP